MHIPNFNNPNPSSLAPLSFDTILSLIGLHPNFNNDILLFLDDFKPN
jgi:hypothetical protein